jgi:hypothetical protein
VALWGVVVVLVVVGTVVAVLISTLGGPGTGTVGQPADTSTAASQRTTSTSQQPTSSASPDPTVQASPSAKETSGSPRPSAQPTRTRSPGSGSPTAAQLTEAITSYYALVPGNTDRAWQRMTTSYQTNHAGGRQAYEQFWGAIRSVRARDVSASPPGRAQATLVYHFKDGRVVTELTSYELVRERGTLKINNSVVLSSSTR